jgi:hypothetical protein
MKREEIIRLAREAGIEHHENVDEMRSPFCDGVWFEDLEFFAALIAAAERERIVDILRDDGWIYCATMIERRKS